MDREIENLLQDLVKSNTALRSFASIVSYDLQEPLNRILRTSQKLKTKIGAALDSQGKSFIDDIERTSIRMKNLLESLLKYSILTEQKINFEQVSLAKVFDKILSELKPKLEENGVQVQIIGNPPKLDADPELISELIRILISNAISFRFPNRSLNIKIEITQSNDLVKIEIEDDGIGFGQDNAAAIFKKFEELHKVDEYNGIAIGLSFCKIICEKHSATLSARTAENLGSIFTLILPVKQGQS